ncbi:hypothetical protein SERLA73DRAFT_182428 [Serpula lacrymans var. lacrymans S7.3]|uniref:MYND-type domain-containing protein n=2 Tax=Serpula lacrymans var. lacrymans TaxID=341189 RepID=F8PXE7_SERL3|nr:uncharacterized protein SERLADRAFT_469083 [Serpula lacrymans var. lacrymans S7.9]EGN99473.1 hypothetical protein SERLA73DRAFT_182428 [Serpula lacrymans var. lacrymans S7.3]EGO25029.1 hypothetical protein SERLADRAFT_469083 [Serpula lacrymans var. lacrymans S7.9]
MDQVERRNRMAPDATPRANAVNLPTAPTMQNTIPSNGTVRPNLALPRGDHAGNVAATTMGRTSSHSAHHHRESDAGPYKDEDVLLSLQLLAYLSKYPHVRQAFYKPRTSFHPASVNLPNSRTTQQQPVAGPSNVRTAPPAVAPVKESHGFFRAFSSATRGKEKEKALAAISNPSGSSPRMTNVFSLVERFTFRPSSSETDLPNPPPKLPPEIQYWAGVIMRNACRKDDSRGGIRQCANMLCGRWETYPREFAKCRRCRKAKYCGKECQSTAWSEGHRFWCSAKDGDDDADLVSEQANGASEASDGVVGSGVTIASGATVVGRTDRRLERHVRERTTAGAIPPNTEDIERARLAGTGPNNAAVASNRTAWSRFDVHRPTQHPNPGYVPPRPHAALRENSPLSNIDTAVSRRRAETVSGATTPPIVAPVSPYPLPETGRAGGRTPDADVPGPSRDRRRVDNSFWESRGDQDMILG